MTVMTGINKSFNLTARKEFVYRSPNDEMRSVAIDQDYYHYSNSSDEICSYIAVFDSESVNLQPFTLVIDGDRKLSGVVVLQRKDPSIVAFEPENFGNSAFAMTMSDLQSGQDPFVLLRIVRRDKPAIGKVAESVQPPASGPASAVK